MLSGVALDATQEREDAAGNGVMVLNRDDPRVLSLVASDDPRVETFGLNMPIGAPKNSKFLAICAPRAAESSRAMPTSSYISRATSPRQVLWGSLRSGG